MRPSGLYADYQGETYPVTATGRDYVLLTVGASDPEEVQGPGIVKRLYDTPYGNQVKVLTSALDRLVSRRVFGSWRGGEISVEGVSNDSRAWYYTNAGPSWDAANGAEGSQHDGWRGRAPLSELTDVRVEEKDLPLRRDW